MIQFVCIGGKAQHGKSTTAEFLRDELEKHNKRVLIINYGDLLKYLCTKYFGWDGKKDEPGRALLQYVGTDKVRKQCEDYWVDFVADFINLFRDEWDYVIVGDCRFPNEISRISYKGFPCKYIRVERANFDNGLTEEQKKHLSEIALDNIYPDYKVENNGALTDLQHKVCLLCAYLLQNEKEGGDRV